jgi:putative hydrolase of the HAD superfamily
MSSATPSHKAWLVDCDGTLYHGAPVRVLMGLELLMLGLGALPIVRAFRAQHEYLRHHPEECAPNPYAAQLRAVATQLHLPEDQVATVVAKWMQERPGKWLRLFKRGSLIDAITEHRAQGGLTALVSDYPAAQKLAALGVNALFDVIVAAGEPGGATHLKPDPEGYLLAAQALNVSPAECLVLGDRTDADGDAAKAAGMDFRLIG